MCISIRRRLTPKEHRKGYQSPMLRLEALHQRGQSNGVEEGVEEVGMYEGESVQAVHWRHGIDQQDKLPPQGKRSAGSHGYGRSVTRLHCLLVASDISLGIKAPHCVTLQTVCSSTSQKMRMITRQIRVNKGRRRI